MLKIARVLLLTLLLIFWFVFGLLLCLVRPRHPNNVYVFARMYQALRPECILVTYCAQGEFKRRLKHAGFSVDRMQGPPGKREMTRAYKG